MTTPAPDSNAPAPAPAANPTTAAAAADPAATATSSQSTATADLAATLAAPPPVIPAVIKATVTAVNLTGSPPVISVTLQGDTTTTIASVRFIDSYSPVTGDTCLVVKQGSDIFALGQMNDSNAGVSNGWQTPSLGGGVTTNGNTNGPVQFRIVVDNGDNKIQLKGSVAMTAGSTALWTMPAGYRPTTKRSVLVARDVGTGSNVAQVDFNTDGTVVLVGGTTVPTESASGTGATSTSTVSISGGTSTSTVGISGTTGSDNQNHSHFTGTSDSAGETNGHDHGYSGSEGGHSHSYSGTEGGHSHSGPSHTHAVTVTAPVWISFNNVQFFT